MDENAALIAEHLEAAGDLRAAFDWHMRAGTWLDPPRHRRGAGELAARATRRRPTARDDPDRTAMRIAPRTLLCATRPSCGGSVGDTGFDELRELAGRAGDKVSLAMGMTGPVTALVLHARFDEAARLASELASLLESIGDPTFTLGLLYCPLLATFFANEIAEALRLAQRMIELADGDPGKENVIIGSPLAIAFVFRANARCCVGDDRWRADIDVAVTMGRRFDATTFAIILLMKYCITVPNGAMVPDAAALQESGELLEIAERSGDNFTLACARYVRGIILTAHDGEKHADGFGLLAAARDAAVQERFTMIATAIIDTIFAQEKVLAGDLDGAIELLRAALDLEFASGGATNAGPSSAALVDALLRRGADTDLQEARAAIDRLAAVPTDPGFVMHEIWLLRLRALLARAHGDTVGYRDYRDRYRAMAKRLGFEGHIAIAEAMT